MMSWRMNLWREKRRMSRVCRLIVVGRMKHENPSDEMKGDMTAKASDE